jgi:hypothetical protein
MMQFFTFDFIGNLFKFGSCLALSPVIADIHPINGADKAAEIYAFIAPFVDEGAARETIH